jgi:activator of HSP90 ATPase
MNRTKQATQMSTRRELLAELTLGAGVFSLVLASGVAKAAGAGACEGERIHQEVRFTAPVDRVYTAILQEKHFQQVVLLSEAVQSGMVKATPPARISTEPGGRFSIFGGFITGRHVELIPNKRIVQAWRAADWPAGVYSIAKFDLLSEGAGSNLVFDHTGFPQGAAQHLAQGWQVNYWQPIARFLSTQR